MSQVPPEVLDAPAALQACAPTAFATGQLPLPVNLEMHLQMSGGHTAQGPAEGQLDGLLQPERQLALAA